jgi:hypothetical protein
VSPQPYCASCSSIQNFGSYLGGACSPFVTGLVVDRTGSFVSAINRPILGKWLVLRPFPCDCEVQAEHGTGNPQHGGAWC